MPCPCVTDARLRNETKRNETEEHGNADDLPTLRTQRWKDIAFGRVLTFDNWIVEPAVFGHWIL